jgi:hypothetical protein
MDLDSLWIRRVKLQYHHIRLIRKMVHRAIGKVRRIGPSRRAVGKFRSRMREHRVPPFEEPRRVTSSRNRIISRTMTRRHCTINCFL